MKSETASVEIDRELAALEDLERLVLWLAVRMVDHANRERPSTDALKVGGHQASSASLVSAMTALYFSELRTHDRVAVKPHASPVLHAIEYLLGWLPRDYLTTLRDFGGLQPYPSRTKDPVPVDYSTGSVGLGAAAPLFGALVQRYTADHFGTADDGRFFAVMGDAELDEGNVWEAILDPAARGLERAVWIVDFNRQSLDRVVPMIRATELETTFNSAGWNVVELKYGRRLRSAYAEPGGDLLRRRIDEMPNQEYQALFAADEARIRETLERGLAPGEKRKLRRLLGPHDGSIAALIQDLGGHDIADVREALRATRDASGPTVIFAYTVKGYRLPIAGHRLNHAALLSGEQVGRLRESLAIGDDDWPLAEPDSPAAEVVAAAVERLGPRRRPGVPTAAPRLAPRGQAVRAASTQEAFGRVLVDIARDEPDVARRMVTASPDVSVSTSLGGWINRVGVYGRQVEESYDDEGSLRWRVAPEGQHIELGISEMNLFLVLSQLGLSYELLGELLLPIGTVYDPFVCRGLDALIYGLYGDARFVIAGTPSGLSLSREGGAHQSLVTPSLGIELPGLTYAEPTYPTEVDWLLRAGLQAIADRSDDGSLYLRLSTKPVDAAPFEELRAHVGDDVLHADVLAGGYRLSDPAQPDVTIAACGAMLPEALAAADLLAHDDGYRASVIALVSPDRLFRDHRGAVQKRISKPDAGRATSHLERLFGPDGQAPIVSVLDGASHALAFIGGALGRRQLALGVDRFGQAGSLAAVYDAYEVSPDAIAAACVAAIADHAS